MISKYKMRNKSKKSSKYIYEIYSRADKICEGTLNEIAKKLYISPTSIRNSYIKNKMLFGKYLVLRREQNEF